MRYSKQREEILSIIRTNHDHLSADMIYEKVKEVIGNISLGTVYRNLAQLVSEGYIIQIKGLDDRTYYDKTIIDHGHLFCNICKKVSDIDHFSVAELKKSVLSKSKFEIVEYHIAINGICHECQKGGKKNGIKRK